MGLLMAHTSLSATRAAGAMMTHDGAARRQNAGGINSRCRRVEGKKSTLSPSPSSLASRGSTVKARVVQDPTEGSIDFSGSIDVDYADDLRREVVERDTAESLRKTIANMGGEMVIDPAAFVSTDYERAVTTGLFASCGALVARGVAGVAMAEDAGAGGSPLAYASLAGTAALAYVLSDLGTGVFHWSVDNYGGPKTPVMGNIINAFQGHHKYPWTITKRQFANNIHTTCPATMCATVPLLLLPGMSPASCVFFGVFSSLVVFSQQTHAWSHMKKSELPAPVLWAQDAGVLLSRKAHGQHHRAPFAGNYCIVSGLWNPLLDGSGFFNKLERVIYDATGVAPRCWSDNDDFDVQEEAPEGWGNDVIH